MKETTIILGIDPGLANVGYGLIATDGVESRVVDYGSFETPAGEALAARLLSISEFLRELAGRHGPERCAVETLYFAKNTKTAMQVAQARGAALVALAGCGVEVEDITPLQIKQALTGYGRAEKSQIQMMVRTLLGLEEIPRPDHAADALAAALACAHGLRRGARRRGL